MTWRNPPVDLLVSPCSANHPSNSRNPMRVSLRSIGYLAALLAIPLLSMAPQRAEARDIVNFSEGSAGTIVIKTNQRRLYYVLGGGQAGERDAQARPGRLGHLAVH